MVKLAKYDKVLDSVKQNQLNYDKVVMFYEEPSLTGTYILKCKYTIVIA